MPDQIAPTAPDRARLVLATHNEHKVGELRAILLQSGAVPGLVPEDVVGAGAFDIAPPVEDGLTFAENALLKARVLARPPACLLSQTTRGSLSTSSAERPGSSRHDGRGVTATTVPTSTSS